MKWKKNNKGFSLAELLVVVAIIVILMGVAFVAVYNHQRSMTRLEFDGIAKEIFIAAQNHLTSAEGQGYLQSTEYGNKGTLTDDEKDGVYFVLKSDSMLDLMLPFASIDETVRAGGTYIIRYQPSSGTVLDVFYSFPGRSSLLTISGKALDASDYPTLMGDSINYREGGERNREQYPGGVVGWYGSVEPLPIGERIDAPELIIHNEEILWVEIRSSAKNELNSGTSLKLTVKGDVSGTQIAFDLKSTSDNRVKQLQDGEGGSKVYAVILDDITTSGRHFSDLKYIDPADNTIKTFNPGENISVEAVAFNNTKLTNIAYSGKKTTNSLFADIEAVTSGAETKYNALIENFRHFENLDRTISAFDSEKAYKDKNDTAVVIGGAKQIKDMNWNDNDDEDAFIKRIHTLRESFKYDTTGVTIYNSDNTQGTTTADTLYPISPDYPLTYDGQSNAVSNVKVNHTVEAGLFGKLTENGSEVKNLKLIDFEITGTTSAGALVGSAANTTITNVVAYNSKENDSKFINDDTTADKKPNVTASGAAGGLIGSMTGGKAEKSAAAVYVKGGTAAGGLIGSVTGDNNIVTACYSGGHTYSGDPKYAEGEKPDPARTPNAVRYYDANNNPMYNVIAASGTAGGLIGSAGTAAISNSYSTCSASGTTAGGFVGTGGAISNCYCTGLVKGTTAEGAFAASVNSVTNSQFYEIINERSKTDSGGKPTGYDYLKPLGNVEASAATGVTALDASASAYDTFSVAPANWKEAKPYDAGGTESYGLKVYYKYDGKTCYNLKTVEQLGATLEKESDGKVTDFVSTHYGDWPAPEEFIFN